MEALNGALGFLIVACVIFIVMEISVLFEELFTVRAQLRKGFAGSKSNIFKIFSRHVLRFLRMSESFGQNIGAGNIKRAVRVTVLGTLCGFVLLTLVGLIAFIFAPSIVAFGRFGLRESWTAREKAGWPLVGYL